MSGVGDASEVYRFYAKKLRYQFLLATELLLLYSNCEVNPMNQHHTAIKQTRERLNLTQLAVAEAARIPLDQYQKYETGEYELANARIVTAYRICLALGLNPSVLFSDLEAQIEEDLRPKKAVLYACFSSNAKPVSPEALSRLACTSVEDMICDISDVYIDYGKAKPFTQREQWKKAIRTCEDTAADLLIVPAMSMLSTNPVDLAGYLQCFKKQICTVDIHFLLERINTADDDFDTMLNFYCAIEGTKDDLRRRKRDLKRIYNNALSSASY